MPRLPLILIIAGLSAAVFSQLGSVEGVALVDDEGLLGPEWLARIPDVAGGLGLSAALCGAICWRWPDRLVAGIVAVLLALGTAFVVWWLVAPPYVVFDRAGLEVGWDWSLLVATAELVVATVCAAALARTA